MTDMDMKNTPKAKITGDALIDLLDKNRDDANIHCADQSGSVDEFLKTYNVGRAVLWNAKAGQFYSRAYSASTSARLANEAFRQFKERQNK